MECFRELLVELPHFSPLSVSKMCKESGQHLGFCSRGGKIVVFAYQGGQALHDVQYNIYIVKFQGGQTSSKGGGECPPAPPK